MYLGVGGIKFASFYDFSVGLWKCPDSVVFILFSFYIIIMHIHIYSPVERFWVRITTISYDLCHA